MAYCTHNMVHRKTRFRVNFLNIIIIFLFLFSDTTNLRGLLGKRVDWTSGSSGIGIKFLISVFN
jgi:hypothetical protein